MGFAVGQESMYRKCIAEGGGKVGGVDELQVFGLWCGIRGDADENADER